VLVHQNVIEVPVEGRGKGQQHLFVEVRDYLASGVHFLCTMFDYLSEGHLLRSYCIHLHIIFRLKGLDYQFSHVLGMHELQWMVSISRHRIERELFDQIGDVVDKNALLCSSSEYGARFNNPIA
jgi:hypothetical protein